MVRLSSEHPRHSAHTSEYCCLYTPSPEIWISLLNQVFLLPQGCGLWYIALLLSVNASIRKQGSYPALSMAFSSYMVRCLMDRKAPRQPCLPLRFCHIYPVFTHVPFVTQHSVGSGKSCGFRATPLRLRFLSRHAAGIMTAWPQMSRRFRSQLCFLRAVGFVVTN